RLLFERRSRRDAGDDARAAQARIVLERSRVGHSLPVVKLVFQPPAASRGQAREHDQGVTVLVSVGRSPETDEAPAARLVSRLVAHGPLCGKLRGAFGQL